MPARLSRMTPARHALYALVACATSAAPASACCLTDWLYGRPAAYAVAPAAPVTPGYAAACPTTPYAAGYTPYTAGYTPIVTAGSNTTTMPLAGTSIYSQQQNYAAQQPAYGAVPLNNPSVYSDLPVTSGYRGAVPAGGSPYGTGNVYPNSYTGATTTAASPVYQANYSSSVQLPVTPTNVAPQQGGLSRFFNSMLGTGYRTSYYTAPITYYRPATTVDPVTGTTVTVQQSCASTVQQVQRTPYTTFAPSPSATPSLPPNASCGVAPSGGIAPCNATSPYAPSVGSTYGSTSPSTVSPYASPGSSVSNGDLQPLSPPTLPPPPTSGSNYSSRLSYPEPDTVDTYSNLAPLTRSSFDSVPSYQREMSSDLEPLTAPSLNSAQPAYSSQQEASKAADDAYRQGYEAGRAALQKQADEESSAASQPPSTAEKPTTDPYGSNRPTEPTSPPNQSHYQLNPPESNPPSSDASRPRTQSEVQRDERDLQELTTGLPSTQGTNQLAYGSSDSAPRVRPIPAPEDYRNPFDTTEQSRAPNPLPALPPPAAPYYRPLPQTSSHSQPPQRVSVPVREASIQGSRGRIAARPRQETSSQRTTGQPQSPAPRANAWQTEVRQPPQESGWYATDR
ncbi:hypothetical protein [Allorhodopirellula solitaria]|uniref:Uncharacterized protein n=1 Tax=Allorhodopirellula solitaria TaxID=2527987 RepID=A0A5C5YFT5_9BACT|nr:hypothetical protein [Allorhodopirellula solitaria]TWT73944.1 hypothetical protein CA85_08260 [Allorhodopirellula solitaria]